MYDVIYDPVREVAALVDTDNGRALGPMLAGAEDHVRPMFDTFVGGLNADPATLHPADLDHHFRSFIEVLAEDEEASSGGAAGSAPGAGAPAGAPSAAAADAPAGEVADRPTEAAGPGETGGLAGPPTGTEEAPAGASGTSGAAVAGLPADKSGVVADAGLPTGVENARPGASGTPGEAATPVGTEGAGVPKV